MVGFTVLGSTPLEPALKDQYRSKHKRAFIGSFMAWLIFTWDSGFYHIFVGLRELVLRICCKSLCDQPFVTLCYQSYLGQDFPAAKSQIPSTLPDITFFSVSFPDFPFISHKMVSKKLPNYFLFYKDSLNIIWVICIKKNRIHETSSCFIQNLNCHLQTVFL